jgi:hypothetical protein
MNPQATVIVIPMIRRLVIAAFCLAGFVVSYLYDSSTLHIYMGAAATCNARPIMRQLSICYGYANHPRLSIGKYGKSGFGEWLAR